MYSNRMHITEYRLLLHCLAADSHSGDYLRVPLHIRQRNVPVDKMTLSTDDGTRELRLAFIVNPASEKILEVKSDFRDCFVDYVSPSQTSTYFTNMFT